MSVQKKNKRKTYPGGQKLSPSVATAILNVQLKKTLRTYCKVRLSIQVQ